MDKPHTLALLARAPTPGRSKTRLIPRLGPTGACEFSHAALTDLMHLMSTVPTCCRILFYTPAGARPDLEALLQSESLESSWGLHPQPETPDLGGRLSAALEHAKETCTLAGDVRPVVTFVGMDCFDLTPESVQASMRLVSESNEKAHMIPASDGGYVLLTVPLSCNGDAIFSGIEWSTNKTGQMQRQRLEDSEISCELVSALPDVDEPDDLDTLWRTRESKQQHFPRTFEFLSKVMPGE